MGFFNKIFSRNETAMEAELPAVSDEAIVALGNGNLIDVTTVSDEMFAQQLMGKTIAFKLTDKMVVSPANGKIELCFPTGHAFAVKMTDGTCILVHIGIDTVSLNGKGFKMLVNVGDTVKAGQPVVEVDWSVIQEAGLDTSTMLIITEPAENVEYFFIEPTEVTSGQQINL